MTSPALVSEDAAGHSVGGLMKIYPSRLFPLNIQPVDVVRGLKRQQTAASTNFVGCFLLVLSYFFFLFFFCQRWMTLLVPVLGLWPKYHILFYSIPSRLLAPSRSPLISSPPCLRSPYLSRIYHPTEEDERSRSAYHCEPFRTVSSHLGSSRIGCTLFARLRLAWLALACLVSKPL